jgi:hypothetical protein
MEQLNFVRKKILTVVFQRHFNLEIKQNPEAEASGLSGVKQVIAYWSL